MQHLRRRIERTVPFSALALYSALGCASAPAPAPAAPAPAAPTLGGPAVRTVELPGIPGPGEPREARALVDEPALKLATIVLRRGTTLPTHHADVPVTIVALHGTGTVIVGADRYPIGPTQAVVLAPKAPHAVEPTPDTDLVLLVHHLGNLGPERAHHH